MDRPSSAELIQWLDEPLTNALGDQYGKLEIAPLYQASTVADGTTVLLLRGAADRSRAVVLCSAPISPDMVQRAMRLAHQARTILSGSVGGHILEPLAQGRVRGLSYAVLPFCDGLSESRPVWWIQRALLRASIFDWLWHVTEITVRDVEPTAIDASFGEPLRRMASMAAVNDGLRGAAKRASERLDAGVWTPRQVLMHGDLWKGNILIRKDKRAAEQRRWRDRFVVIDWAGSEIQGYAMYDLVRLAESMRLTAPSLRSEVDRHCRLLRCARADATSYLLAALGHVAKHLEHFPVDRYARMAGSSLTTLERALE